MRRPQQLGQIARPLHENGDQPLERTVPASDAREAVSEHSAAEELPELLYDEAGHPTAVRFRVYGREELGEVRADDAVEPTAATRPGVAADAPAPVTSLYGRRRFIAAAGETLRFGQRGRPAQAHSISNVGHRSRAAARCPTVLAAHAR